MHARLSYALPARAMLTCPSDEVGPSRWCRASHPPPPPPRAAAAAAACVPVRLTRQAACPPRCPHRTQPSARSWPSLSPKPGFVSLLSKPSAQVCTEICVDMCADMCIDMCAHVPSGMRTVGNAPVETALALNGMSIPHATSHPGELNLEFRRIKMFH